MIIDLYHGDGIRAHVVSKEFFEDIKACVSKNGTVLMNTFYGVKNLSSKKALLKTISDVFGSVVAFEAPLKSDADITQGYLLARNVIGNWNFSVTLNGVPELTLKRLLPILKNWVAYTSEHEFFNDIDSIRDGSNDWVRQANYVDITYRKRLTQSVPWQVLLD